MFSPKTLANRLNQDLLIHGIWVTFHTQKPVNSTRQKYVAFNEAQENTSREQEKNAKSENRPRTPKKAES